jgi:hypothetical protein
MRNSVVSSTGTVIGLEISQNPQTQMYQAKLGYNRGELAYVPTDKTDTNAGASNVANVLMEMRYSSIFDLKNSGIYQRLAVGTDAVKQPGAAFLFAKDQSGTITAAAGEALNKAMSLVPKSNPQVESDKLILARAFKLSDKRDDYDTVAKGFGYQSFADFLIEIETTPAKVSSVAGALKAAGLFP